MTHAWPWGAAALRISEPAAPVRAQAMYKSAQGLLACLTQRRARVDTKVQLHVSFQIEVAVTRPNCVESFDYVVALAVYSRDWFS
jgi:hypothetical protein